MKKLPNFVKWLIIAVVLAAMAAMMAAVNDRASGWRCQCRTTVWASTARRLPLESESKNETGLLEGGPVFA